NTLLKPRDYEYILRDSRATVVIASEPLVAAVEEVRPRSPELTHVVVAGRPAAGQLAYAELVGAESAELQPAVTTKDDVAFWQYTSGTTGMPKAAVHLHHDMLVCCEAFGRHVLERLAGIGSTEMCHTCIANRRGTVRPGSSGTVVPGYEAKLVDDAGHDVAIGEVGNLIVKGDSACSCYWNEHERTKQTIEGEWVRTGDKYTRDADGYFWYAGRTDDMIKAGGMWV